MTQICIAPANSACGLVLLPEEYYNRTEKLRQRGKKDDQRLEKKSSIKGLIKQNLSPWPILTRRKHDMIKSSLAKEENKTRWLGELALLKGKGETVQPVQHWEETTEGNLINVIR